jgi:hypothetical protein
MAIGLTAPLLAAGCSLRLGQPGDDVAAALPSVGELARARAADEADALAVRADAAATLRPDARRLLSLIAAEHRSHAAALRPPPGPTTPTPTRSPAATTASAATAAGPGDRATVLPDQATAERAASTAVEADLPRVGADVARLLASVAASRTVHAELIDQVTGGRP